jgi:hypothetical protein
LPINHSSTFSDLTEAQYAALGKTVVEWANVEFLLGVLLSRLLGTPEFLVRTYTDSMSAVRMQGAIVEAVEIHRVRYGFRLISSEILLEVDGINGQVTALRGMRNKIAHFCWSRRSDESLFGTSFPGGIPSEKSEKREHAMVTLFELENLNVSAHGLVDTLLTLVEKIPSVDEWDLMQLMSRPLQAR